MTNDEAVAMLLPHLASRRMMASAGVLTEISWDEWVARGWDDGAEDREDWEDYNAHVREDAEGEHVHNVAMVEVYELAIRALGGNPDDADLLFAPTQDQS